MSDAGGNAGGDAGGAPLGALEAEAAAARTARARGDRRAHLRGHISMTECPLLVERVLCELSPRNAVNFSPEMPL